MPINYKSDHHATFEVVLTADVGAVGAASVLQHTFTVAGVDPASDVLVAVQPEVALPVGIAIGQGRVSALNTVIAPFINPTAAIVDPPSQNYRLVIGRK